MMLQDDDPSWDESSGGDGHRGTEWESSDAFRAEAFYASLSKNTKLIFDLMIDRPGERLDADWIASQLHRWVEGKSVESGRRSVSASLSATKRPYEVSGRRLPFYWWPGTGGAASTYAMKPSVAKLFALARSRLDPALRSQPTATLSGATMADSGSAIEGVLVGRSPRPSYRHRPDPAESVRQQHGDRAGLRTLYLTRFASAYNNEAFTGRNIAERFCTDGGDILIRHWLCASREQQIRRNPDLENDATDAAEFEDFAPDIIVFEGGLYSDGINWRIPQDIAVNFVKSGGIIIVADADQNEVSLNFDSYKRDLPFFGAHLDGDPDSPLRIRYIRDLFTGDGGPEIICDPTNPGPTAPSAATDPKISQVLAVLPVALLPAGTALLWTPSTADVLAQDLFVESHRRVPIATVRQHGLGYAAVITAGVTDDFITNRNPDNIEWLYTTASILARRAARERQLRSNVARIQQPRDAELHSRTGPTGSIVTPGHAFISYVREDSAMVNRLHSALQAAGVPVWRDTTDLWPGQDWKAQIRQAITSNALVFIACISHNSQNRHKTYQNEELILAIEQLRQHRPDRSWLIPIRLDDCEIPDWDTAAAEDSARCSAQTCSENTPTMP